MKIKIDITCQNCNCKFEIDSQNYVERETICCPNCGQQFPDEPFKHLQAGMKEFSLVPSCVDSPQGHLLRTGFIVSLNKDAALDSEILL